MVVSGADPSLVETGEPVELEGHRQHRWPRFGAAGRIGLVALALRWWQPGETLRTTDEFMWLVRSHAFGAAVRRGDLAAASAGPVAKIATRPGITTMWIGFAGEELGGAIRRVATGFGLGPGPSTLRTAHLIMGLVCAVGVWVFTVLAVEVVGRRGGSIAGALLAAEPVLVGHSAVLHTDAIVSVFAAIAVLALIASGESLGESLAGSPTAGRDDRRAHRLAALGGAAAAVALLTKVNATVIVVPALAVAPTRVALSRWLPKGVRPPAGLWRCAVISLVVCAVVSAVAWPSSWVDPLGQARATVSSARLAGEWTGDSVFLGTVTNRTDRRFYVVAAWYRLSGWFLIAMIASAFTWATTRVLGRGGLLARRVSLQMWVPPVLYAAAIVVSAKHYDRYLLPLVPFVALGIGCTAARTPLQRVPPWAGWAMFGAAALWTASLAPFAIAHVDPLVGGQRGARAQIPLGWGEGIETLLARLPTSPSRCPTISSRRWLVAQPGCFQQQDFAWLSGDADPPDYVLIYISDRQVGRTAPEDHVLAQRGRLVDSVKVQGVTYAELWTVDAAAGATTDHG